ncbi:MAG: serine/threonine-protein kinase, partial [Planctomycetota bacterium]
ASDLSLDELKKLFAQQARYSLQRQLGAGGMGAVYLARHERMGRDVAIKVIRPELTSNPKTVQRFQQEVQSAAMLSHRNVVTAFDADQADEIHFLVMEYVEGESLSQTVARKGPLSVAHACSYVLQAANGLKHAHEKGMIHRDVKPANLMRTPKGVVKVMDFGLARSVATEATPSELTASGVVLGTASFIAPEQAQDARAADERSDLYSLGCTLFYLLAGRTPFQKQSYVEQVVAHCTDTFPDIRELRNDIPSELFDVLAKLTQKDPGLRYQSAKDLTTELTPITKTLADQVHTQIAPKPELTLAGRQDAEDAATIAHTEQGVATPVDSQAIDASTPQTSTPERPQKGVSFDRRYLLFGGIVFGGVLAAILNLSGLFSSGDDIVNTGPETGDSPKALLVLSARSFWYSDYGPIRAALGAAGIECVVASSQTGFAQFNPRDSAATDRQEVKIDEALNAVVGGNLSQYGLIVFMGEEYQGFVGEGESASAVGQLLEQAQGKSWIGAIGMGLNIPIAHRAFDDCEITQSQWIASTNDSTHRTAPGPVVVDHEHRVITGNGWQEASAFARTLVEQMQESNSEAQSIP